MKGSNLFSDAPEESFETVDNAKRCNTNEKEADVFCTLYIFYFIANANDDEK